MIDIKETITILCKCLQDTVDSALTPEHFRIAKYNKSDDNVVNAFWTTLEKLSHFGLTEIYGDISFCNFDKCTRTKLYLAYLQYPSLKLYGLSEVSNNGSRSLLIALAWLITNYDVLKNIVKSKLINSSLGREFSKVNIESDEESDDVDLTTIENQINNLLYKSNKLGNNLKAISELYEEKVKLITRVHAASLNTSGLPHLTVSEMSLVKKIETDKTNSEVGLKQLIEMEKTASMLDSYMKWTKKNHIFYTWMNTVLDEYEKEEELFNSENLAELSKFIYLLKHKVKKRLKSLKNDGVVNSTSLTNCPSRFLRIQKCLTEVQTYLDDTKNKFTVTDDNLQKMRNDLDSEFQTILKSIPNCYQI